MEVKSNNILLAELDDVVQRLAKLDNLDWSKLHDDNKKQFELIKKEIQSRLES